MSLYGEPENPEWEWETAFCYGDDLIVFRRCPLCGRFIKPGVRVISREDAPSGPPVVFEGWECKHCGPITPDWTRGEFLEAGA